MDKFQRSEKRLGQLAQLHKHVTSGMLPGYTRFPGDVSKNYEIAQRFDSCGDVDRALEYSGKALSRLRSSMRTFIRNAREKRFQYDIKRANKVGAERIEKKLVALEEFWGENPAHFDVIGASARYRAVLDCVGNQNGQRKTSVQPQKLPQKREEKTPPGVNQKPSKKDEFGTKIGQSVAA